MSDKILSEEELAAVNSLPMTEAVTACEPHGNILIVVVGAGVYRQSTAIAHLRVVGESHYMAGGPRRAHVVGIEHLPDSLGGNDLAIHINQKASKIHDCVVAMDIGGLGIQVAKAVEWGGNKVIRISWGASCNREVDKLRYYNQRAQCVLAAAKALKDGRLSFADGLRSDFACEASRLPFYADPGAVIHVAKRDAHGTSDHFDAVCMAFLEDIPGSCDSLAQPCGKAQRDAMDQQLDGRTTVAEVIQDLRLYDQILDRGQLMGKMMSRNLIEVVRRLHAQVERLEKDRDADTTIDERDHAEEMADKLAAAISERFRVEVGEHSNMNCPWTVALEIMNGEFLTDSDQDRELDSLRKRIAIAIELTPAEIQSGFSRVLWAQGLIVQLPEDHEGRNSWLMNYGDGKP